MGSWHYNRSTSEKFTAKYPNKQTKILKTHKPITEFPDLNQIQTLKKKKNQEGKDYKRRTLFSDLAFSFLKTAFLSEKGSDAMAEKIFTEILRARERERERETQGVNDNKNRTLPERKGGEKYG